MLKSSDLRASKSAPSISIFKKSILLFLNLLSFKIEFSLYDFIFLYIFPCILCLEISFLIVDNWLNFFW